MNSGHYHNRSLSHGVKFTVMWVFALNTILKYTAKQLSITTFPQKCHGAVFNCNYKEW